MCDGKYVLIKGEQVLWEGYTSEKASLKEKGTNISAIWFCIILIAVSVAFSYVTGFYIFLSVAFFAIFAIIANFGYQCGKFVITDKRVLWGERRNKMMYYAPITRKCTATFYKGNNNTGFIRIVRSKYGSGQKNRIVIIRGIENPEQVCNILQNAINNA